MSKKKVGITVGEFQKFMDDFEIVKFVKSILVRRRWFSNASESFCVLSEK